MQRDIRTAVVATVSQELLQQLVFLLSSHQIELLAVAEDGKQALELLQTHRPDLLLADAQLPILDGCALLNRALCSFQLPVHPAAMLMYFPEFPILGAEDLRQAGVATIQKPLTRVAFHAALQQLQTALPAFSNAHSRRVEKLLDDLGVPAHPGRDCLKYAALLCAADERNLHQLSGRLYPQLAEICQLEPVQVERAMRYAIDLAWRSDKSENQNRIFADTVDAGRGQPTCSEMISRLADILRLEG